MATYEPLNADDPYTDNEDTPKDLLSPNDNTPAHKPSNESKLHQFGALVLVLASAMCAVSMCISATHIEFPGERSAMDLRMPDQYSTLALTDEFKHGPKTWFPQYIVRANRQEPDRVYTSGSHVIINDNNSMFFQIPVSKSKFTKCYIGASVPSPAERLSSNQTFFSSGPITSFQVWNVSVPISSSGKTTRLKSVSWNTRPQRVGLLGTIAFLSQEERMGNDDYQDGWQLKAPTARVECGDKQRYTVEVTCEGCHLEFEQVYVEPPLAFELFQIG